MTDQTQQTQSQDTNIDPNDLDLVDDRLEDEGKDDAALWAELDQAESATTNDPDAEGSGEEGAADDDQGSGSDSAATAVTDRDDASSGESQSDGDQPPDSANRQAPENDLWAQATPEQRAAYEAAQEKLKKLEQAERSNRGRLSAMQRQINEMTTSKPAAAKAADKQDGQDADAGTDGFLASGDWKSFQDEYPEVAGPLGKLIGGLQEQLTRQEKELSAIGTERRQSALDEQATLLFEEHSDWEQVTADRGFVDWLSRQPRHIQEAAYRNANEIVDAAEAADVVGRYKQTLSQHGGGNAQQNDTSRADDGRGTGNNRLAGKRQHQLESASTARSRGPGAATGIPEDGDPERLWKQFDEMERRQARA